MRGDNLTRYSGKGWRKQSTRHSNARKYGKAGGTYLTNQDRRNIKNFKKISGEKNLTGTRIIIPGRQRIRGLYDESTNTITLPRNSPDDLLCHEISHALDYKYSPPTKHDEEFYSIKNELESEINQKV